jgi:hypothetical protein
MSTTIQDGTGTRNRLRVTGQNRLLSQAVIITEEDNAIVVGDGYQIASTPVSFTGANETAVLYTKNTDDRDFVLDRAVLILGTAVSASSDQDWTFRVLRNPTSGTIIDNALSAGISNSNHGSANIPNGDNFKGVEGDTLVDGTGAPQKIKQSIDRIILPLGRRLPKGTSIGFKLTPPNGTVAATALVVTHWWYDNDTLG